MTNDKSYEKLTYNELLRARFGVVMDALANAEAARDLIARLEKPSDAVPPPVNEAQTAPENVGATVTDIEEYKAKLRMISDSREMLKEALESEEAA